MTSISRLIQATGSSLYQWTWMGLLNIILRWMDYGISRIGSNNHATDHACKINTIAGMTFHPCGGYRTELIRKLLHCQQTMRLLICWDLQNASWRFQFIQCQISLAGYIYIEVETDTMNTSWVQPTCNIQGLQVREDPPEKWLETNFDIRMHCKFSCYESQTAGWYGRHLQSKHPQSSVAWGAWHDNLLKYFRDLGTVQRHCPEQWRQNSGRRQTWACSIFDICNNLLARVAKDDRATGSELLASAATTEKVSVSYILDSGQHDAEVEASQDSVGYQWR